MSAAPADGHAADVEVLRALLISLGLDESWKARQTNEWIALDRLADALAAAEADRDQCRRKYGAKFNAITAALGWATEASDKFVNGDEEDGIRALDKVVSILVDA